MERELIELQQEKRKESAAIDNSDKRTCRACYNHVLKPYCMEMENGICKNYREDRVDK